MESSSLLGHVDHDAISCLVCGGVYSSEDEMQKHVRSHFEYENSCPFCTFSSSEGDSLQTHVIELHNEELMTPKEDCVPNTTDTENDCSDDQLVCPLCDRRFDAAAINLHVESHFLSEEVPSEHADEIKAPQAGHFPKQPQKKPRSADYTLVSVNSNTDCVTSTNHTEVVKVQDHEQPHCSKTSHLTAVEIDSMIARQLDKEEIKRMHEEKLAKQKAEQIQFEGLQREYNTNPKGTFVSQAFKSMERDVVNGKLSTTDYYSQKFDLLENLAADDRSTCTPLLSNLLSQEIQSDSKGKADLEVYISSNVSHFGRGYGDAGWGCGFRNVQMLLSSLFLFSQYKECMSALQGSIPSIPRLQQIIEEAWSDGFDQRGCNQLNKKLIATRKWIGATEAFTVFASMKLHCRIIDFHKYSDARGKLHPLLFNWVADYYLNCKAVRERQGCVLKCHLPPLYLQHQGHSRSIVGIQYNYRMKKVTHLIMFDPGHTKSQITSALNRSGWNMKSTFLRTISSFKHPQYQIVCVSGIASAQRHNEQKLVDHIAERLP